ncbi:MAG: hypothetical protein H0U35_01640 [Sporichthyaceae bacterium]|nr:hypothetical protein [Sporichthyaceae bacterium]
MTEVALAGRGLVDDHVNAHVVREGGVDTVLIAVKTSLGDRGEPGDSPLVLVLRRSDEGTWSEHAVATVDDNWTRPVIAADVSGTVYVVARRAGGIVMKSALSRDLAFAPGPGTVLMSSPTASLTDPTVPSQTVDPVCGVVVLASDTRRNQYWHAELALDGSEKNVGTACRPAARTVPVPASVVATAQRDGVVRVSWSDPGDSEWTPAGSVSSRRYVVERAGARIGTTAATTFIDRPGSLGSHEYRVRAVSSAGQQSAASDAARVRITAENGRGVDPLSGPGAMALIVILAAVLVGGGYAMSRAVRRRRMEQTRRQVYGAAMAIPLMPAPGGRHARRTSPAVVTSESGEPRPGRRRRELSPTVPGPRTEGD